MSTIRLILEYEGTRYVGWQHQSNGLAIQQVLEEKLKVLFRRRVIVHAAGRTDSGVHALGQVCHLHLEQEDDHDLRRFFSGLNALLPDDIGVCEVSLMPEGFHAQNCAVAKRYRYEIFTGLGKPVLNRRLCWVVPRPLDYTRMREGAAQLIGRHDFSSFRGAKFAPGSPVKTIHSIDFTMDGPYLSIEFHGDGFLKQMVRNIVGTLTDMGRGRRDPAEMPSILAAKDRRAAGVCAPGKGLTMVVVEYPEQWNHPLEVVKRVF